MGRFYITTAIDYSNGDPHLGHALEKVGADAIARYRRLAGDDVHFLMGMDEHGQKVAQTAAAEGITPKELVDRISDRFQAAWARLGISNDQWIRTTDEHHARGVKALIERIHAKSPEAFYEKAYEGWYCVGCEMFKRDDEVVDGHCVLHPTRTLEWTQERNWFFRLTSYSDFVRDHIVSNPDFLRPQSRRNEILALIEQGLEDISITRSRLTWAIPFPIASSDGEHQGTWVWFDALPNYLTATGFPDAGYENRWPADVHVVGKDITRLHAVIWPAMLKAAELPLPRSVWAHGFMAFGGERLSKSAGVPIGLHEAIDRYGPDALRYFMLREIPFDGDGGFSWERFDERYTSELSNSLGNLLSRVLAMVEKYRGGVVPAAPLTSLDEADIAGLADYRAAMDGSRGYLCHEALAAVMRSVARGNEYVQSMKPWALAKDPAKAAELDAVLASAVRLLARAAVCLWPFMPGKAEEMWRQLGGPGEVAEQDRVRLGGLIVAGWQEASGGVLFPRLAPESPLR